MRLPKAIAAAALLLGFHAVGSAVLDVTPSAEAKVEGADISVGDTLQALHDVELDEAIIAKGSKISVSGLKRAGGRVLLDVALADGHVVRAVPLSNIRTNFQRVDG
jgi:hypothetical protein